MKLFSEEILAHYGIPGQKKGIRRWQYEDGRFNEEGKERYFSKSERDKKLYGENLESKGLKGYFTSNYKADKYNKQLLNESDKRLRVNDKEIKELKKSINPINKKINDDFYGRKSLDELEFDKLKEEKNKKIKEFVDKKFNKIIKDVDKKVLIRFGEKGIKRLNRLYEEGYSRKELLDLREKIYKKIENYYEKNSYDNYDLLLNNPKLIK